MAQLFKNVIPFRKPRGLLHQDGPLLQVYEYWNTVRGTRIAPDRTDFDPKQIHSALKHTFVLGARDHKNVRFRIVGHALMENFGMTLHGMPAHALITPGDRDRFDSMISRIMYDPRVVELNLGAGTLNPSDEATGMLLLPLQPKADGTHQIMGVLSAPKSQATTVTRYSITNVVQTPIKGDQILHPTLQMAAEPRAIYKAPTKPTT